MVLRDFESYRNAQMVSGSIYRDRERWNKMSLENIAHAGVFAADRAINDYAKLIWNASPLEK